ncbi:MAG: hypothetical protein R2911_11330 [Caldilineaceae bacterium]
MAAACIGAFMLAGLGSPALFAVPVAEAAAGAPNAAGTIAYVAEGAIRLIDADGANDRLLWQLPDPTNQRITDVDWSPDGTRLAFASDHESTCSFYRSDIYSIRVDGSDLRRLTNSPSCGELAGFPKGSVQVTIKNELTESLFLLYVEGAANAVELPIPPGTQGTVTVDNVADFGDGVLQQVVIFQTEENNWIAPSVTVDVKAGETVAASDRFVISNSTAARSFGAYSPSWRRDGATVAFALSTIGGYQISANPSVAEPATALFPDASIFGTNLAMSPVDEQVLLYSYPMISLGTVGDSASVSNILELTGSLYGMDWLTDGSGMVGAEALGLGNTHANIWRYTFGANDIVNLTNFNDENRGYAFNPSVSPDGAEIVFNYAPTGDAPAELYMMDIDGGNVRSLGVSGLYPDWGMPSQGGQPTPTPSPMPTGQPTPTPTPAGGQFTVDSGFRPNPQGYAFENWGGQLYDNSTDLNAASLIRLFGAANVCQVGTTANDCVLTAAARKWREEQLQGMYNGHCAGFAATSQRFFAGYDLVGNYQSDTASVFDLQPSEAVRNHIAEWATVQSLTPANGNSDGWLVQYGDGTKPSQVLSLIHAQLQNNPNELFYLGIRMEGQGGHAVNPYAIANKGNGIYWLYVYDNNWPGAERYLIFDTNQETWLYNFGAINPGQAQGAWWGDAQTGTLRLRSATVLNSGGWVCPFCGQAEPNPGQTPVDYQVQFQMFGAGKMLIVDQQGRMVGWDFNNSQYVNQISDSSVDQIDNGTGVQLPPIYTLPATDSPDPYIVYFSGDTLSEVVDADLMMAAPGFVVGLEYVQINPGHDLLTTISPDGRQITFNASEEGTYAPDIYFALEPDANGDSYLFGVGGFTLSSLKTVTVTLDFENGLLYFNDDDGAADVYAILVVRIRADGEVEYFMNESVMLDAESDAAMNYGAWDGENAMPIIIDGETQNFDNEQTSVNVYLPLVKKE